MAAEQTPGTPPAAAESPKPAGQRAPIADRMRDAGWKPEDVGEGSHGEARTDTVEPEKPAKAKGAPKKPAPKPTEDETVETAAPDGEEKPRKVAEKPAEGAETDAEKIGARGLLEKLAKEQGLEIQDGKVTTKERAEFRLLKQEQRNQLVKAEKEAIARVEAAQKELADRYKRVEAFEGAIKGRDHQGLAKALGYENWDKLQEDVIAWNADPNYQRIRELEAFKKQQEEQAEQAAQQRQQAAQEQARVQAETKYISDLSGVMKTSQDPLVQSMSDDPLFLRAVYRIQQENWDGRETVTPEQAVRMAASGSRVTLGEELKALHARLDKAFGKKPEPEKPAALAPKPKVAGGPKAAPSLPAKNVGRMDRLRQYSARLSEASERDRKAGSSY